MENLVGMFEGRTLEEIAAGVFVAPELDWHDVGCVKRYGGVSEEKCACERRRDAVTVIGEQK